MPFVSIPYPSLPCRGKAQGTAFLPNTRTRGISAPPKQPPPARPPPLSASASAVQKRRPLHRPLVIAVSSLLTQSRLDYYFHFGPCAPLLESNLRADIALQENARGNFAVTLLRCSYGDRGSPLLQLISHLPVTFPSFFNPVCSYANKFRFY